MIYRSGISIRRKMAMYICMAVFIVMAAGLLAEYFIGYNMLKRDIDLNFNEFAAILAQQVNLKIEEEIVYLKAIASDPILIEAVSQSNMQYQAMGPGAARNSINDIESAWAEETENSPLIRRYLDNPASIELKKKHNMDKDLAEVFVADRRGAVVAASGKTSDFYQADEEWWIDAFAGGRGAQYIGDAELDKSSGALSIPFALPVKDSGDNVIGVLKAVIDVHSFFPFLSKIKIGRTGRAALINGKGEIILKEGVVPLSRKMMCEKCLKKPLSVKNISLTAGVCDIEPVKKFRVFHAIDNQLLAQRGVVWRVVVSQETGEAFAPLQRSIVRISVLMLILTALTVPFSYLFGGLFASPIEKLHRAVDKISSGDLGQKVDISTGDEIESLAQAFTRMSAIVRDRENSLISSKKYIDSIISSMADSLIVTGINGRIKFVNASALRLLGYSEEEIVGKPINDIFFSADEEDRLNKYIEAVSENGSVYNAGMTFLTKAGKPVPVNVSGAVIDGSPEKIGIVSMARDMRPIMSMVEDLEKSQVALEDRNAFLTKMQKAMLHIMGDLKIAKDDLKLSYDKLKVAQEKIVQSEKEAALGRFATGIAHEVKNPLAMIVAGTEFLEAKLTGADENVKRNMTMVKKSALRANDILEGILLYIRPSLMKIERADLNALADEVVQLFKMQTATVKADIAYEPYSGQIGISVDRIQIHQVMFNVIKNAIEASEEYGKITVKTDVVNGSGIVSVTDSGSGMSGEVLSNLYEPFFSTKRPGKGTGLGLVMAKTIMDRHSGKLVIDSAEGKGTTVQIILPLAY